MDTWCVCERLGRLLGAESVFDEAIAYCRANERPTEEHFCLGCLVIVLCGAGEWAPAEEIGRDLASDDRRFRRRAVHIRCWRSERSPPVPPREQKRGARLLGSAHAVAAGSDWSTASTKPDSHLALADELGGVPSARWRNLVSTSLDQICAARPRGLRFASTFAARRGDTTLLNACANATAEYASRFGSADAIAALAHVLGEVALSEGKNNAGLRAVRPVPRAARGASLAVRARIDSDPRRRGAHRRGRA